MGKARASRGLKIKSLYRNDLSGGKKWRTSENSVRLWDGAVPDQGCFRSLKCEVRSQELQTSNVELQTSVGAEDAEEGCHDGAA